MLPLSHKGTFSGVLLSIVSNQLWNIVRFWLLHHQPKIKYLTFFHLETVLWRNWYTVNITKHSHVFFLLPNKFLPLLDHYHLFIATDTSFIFFCDRILPSPILLTDSASW